MPRIAPVPARRLAALVAASLLAAGGLAACGSTSSGGAPSSHTVAEGTPAVMHKSGLTDPLNNCTGCHGATLRGGDGPSCYSCHGQKW